MSIFVTAECPGRKSRLDVRTELIEGRCMRERVIAEETENVEENGFEWSRRRAWGLGSAEIRELRVEWKSLRMKAAGLVVELYTNRNAGKARFSKKRTTPANRLDSSKA
jgi:hypothetical protein